MSSTRWRPVSEEDAHAVDLVKKTDAPAIAVFNKIDKLAEKTKLLALIERYRAIHEFAEYIPISALKGDGLDTLKKRNHRSACPKAPRCIPRTT